MILGHYKVRRGSFVWWLPRLVVAALVVALVGFAGHLELNAELLSHGYQRP